MNEIEVKLKLLEEILHKKKILLNQIYNITENQEQVYKQIKSNDITDILNGLIEEKQKIIDELKSIDNIFLSTFESFKGTLNENRKTYMEKILILQNSIKEISDIDIKIRVKEERNRRNMQLISKQEPIKTIKASKNYILSQYLKNTKKE